MPDQADESDLDILIQTAISDPIGIDLAKSLLREARIPFFETDGNVVARQKAGNFHG